MKLRCSPYNPFLVFVVLGTFIFINSNFASGQCKGDFSFQSLSSEKDSPTGKIEVSLKDPAPGLYTFKVYRMEGEITLVQTKEAPSPDKIIFDELIPSTYFVKIEWGDTCYKTIGGLEGILITEKDQGR